MTEYLAQVVKQGERYRVALLPVSYRGSSPYTAACWAERDSGIFEASTRGEADAFIGQLSNGYWSSPPSPAVVTDELVATTARTKKGKSR